MDRTTTSRSPELDADRSSSRYELLVKIASGGMATVYVGRLRGAVGFWRLVAIKRAHAHLIENPTYKQMLVDEARLASRLHHPNVVAVLDVEELDGELRLVMDYVEGAALSELIALSQKAERRLPARIAVRIALDACAGLHAAHEACDEDGRPLGLVHRDVSPHNILVGLDGGARISDFGIAKQAEGGVSTTTGTLKGKLGYMAPEYVEDGKLDARSDVFALGVVVWEALANEKLFRGSNEVDTLRRVVATKVPPLSSVAPWVGKRLDSVLAAALARSPDERFATAQAFGTALETAARRDDLIASPAEVGAYVRELVGASLEKRRAQVRERTAPIRTEPTVRVSRAPGAVAEVTPGAPEAGTAEPAAELAEPARDGEAPREASNITLRHTASLDAPIAPPRSRGVVAVGLIALAAGGVAAFALFGRSSPPAGAPGTAYAPTATASSTVFPTASPSVIAATTATVVAPVASAAAPTARPADGPRSPLRGPAPITPAGGGSAAKPRPSATAAVTAAPEPGEKIAPNPYATPGKP